MSTRTNQAQFANHTSMSSSPSSLEETAAREQEQATSAAPPGTYHGPVDSASDDNADFDNLSETSRAEDGWGEFVGPPAPRARQPRQQQVVLGSFSERQTVEREGGVSAAAPLRYGVKAMRISLNIDQGYLAEIQADIAGRGTPKLRIETQHLNAWLSVPEIILLVNPGELSWSLANQVQETRTRGGFVQEFWAGELETLSADGQSAVAYVVRNDGHPKGQQGGGLTIRDLRSDSAGYRNLRRLVDVYRSNGVLYGMRAMGNYAVGQGDEKPVFRKTLLYNGYVQIFYDGITYSGFFENFEIVESGDKPFWLTWSFTFKVETVTGRELKVFDSGKFMSPQSGPAEFSSMSAKSNTTGQRNM